MATQKVKQQGSQEHERLDALFHRFQELKRVNFVEARCCFKEFMAGLAEHIVWEEEILFPLFDAKFGHLAGSPTDLMRWEHWQIRDYLRAIDRKLAAEDAETDFEETALHAVLCAHNSKEELMVYPVMDELLAAHPRMGKRAGPSEPRRPPLASGPAVAVG